MTDGYILVNPTHRHAGFFSYIWETIRTVYHHPNKKYYFYFGPESAYYDSTISGFNNAWDYYFQQPHSNTFPTNIEKHVSAINNDTESEYREGAEFNLDYDLYNKRRFVFNNIINQYYKLQPHIQEKIDIFYSSNFLNKKVLGMHCRGTDHPYKKDVSLYLNKIEDMLKQYDVLFAMSDEEDKINTLKQTFGDRVVTYDTFRSNSSTPLHVSPKHNYNMRLLGEEVLIESYLLAKTDFLLLYTGSNVNFYSRVVNPNLQYINL